MNTEQQKHGPLPWRVDFGYTRAFVYDGQNNIVLVMEYEQGGESKIKDNAQFIVQACNAYESNQQTIRELLEACKEAEDNISMKDDGDVVEARHILQSIIAKIEKGI